MGNMVGGNSQHGVHHGLWGGTLALWPAPPGLSGHLVYLSALQALSHFLFRVSFLPGS